MWRGEIMDTTPKALGLARSMTYRGITPTLCKVTKVYRSGVSVARKAMREIEKRLQHKASLEAWSIKIVPEAQLGYFMFFVVLRLLYS